MENKYRNLMKDIHVPAELNDRVLCAARRQNTARTAEQTGPKRLAPGKARPILRGAVCAACALALVLGTVRFYPAEVPADASRSPENGPTVMVPDFSFGLTAYAAEIGETITPNANGGLALISGSGMAREDIGDYTGCLFQITGKDILSVSASVDRGGLYRSETRTGLTDEEVRSLFQQEERGELLCTVYGDSEDAPMNADIMTALGDSFTEDYDPAVNYGFWVPPELYEMENLDEDLRQAAWDSIDTFDGARLTVTVTFADGSEQSKTYRLSTGRLKMVYEDDGTRTVLPILAGDEELCVYGVYAVSESESRFLQWPVQDCTTISLSNPYGTVNGTFHNGIDIPALSGSVILAAADGTVKEIGFDAERGNYLVLDHGDGLETVYATCRDFTVEEGDTVEAGEMIGAVGTSGMSTGSHLCFQVRQDGEPQNPVAYFDSDIRDTLRMG